MTYGVFILYMKLFESASSCEFESLKGGPINSGMRHEMARKLLNSRKAKKKRKVVQIKTGD